MDKNTLAFYAQQIIESPAWMEVFNMLDKMYIDKWLNSNPTDIAGREETFRMRTTLHLFDTVIREKAKDTEAAEEERNNIDMGVM